LKLLKKEKKKWSHGLKSATTTSTTKTKAAKVRAKTADLKHIRYAIISVPLEVLSDKLNILFESRHARWMNSHYPFLQIIVRPEVLQFQ